MAAASALPKSEPELTFARSKAQVPRLQRLAALPEEPGQASGAQLLSGGTGGLGLLTGRWLGEAGASSLVLAARGGKVAAADAAKLKKLSECAVRVVKCDAAELTDTRRMLAASHLAARGSRARGTRRACCPTGCCTRRRRRPSSASLRPRRLAAGACRRRAPRRRSRRWSSSRRSPPSSAAPARATTRPPTAASTRERDAARPPARPRRRCSGARGRTSAWRRRGRSTRGSRRWALALSRLRRAVTPSRLRWRWAGRRANHVHCQWGKFLGGMKEVPAALSGFAPARKAGAAVAKKASAPAKPSRSTSSSTHSQRRPAARSTPTRR